MANFYKWMTKRRRNDSGMIGDLARDMKDDDTWNIEMNDIDKMHDYLMSCGACIEAHYALDSAWAMFTNQENKHWFFNEYENEDEEIEVSITIKVRPQVTARTRFKIMKRDGYRCCLCGRDANDGVKLEIDHRTAVANGGSNDDDNLWTLCFECNRGKRTEEL